MADRTVTVKSSGGDYTSLNAALAGESKNLVTNTQILTIECYAISGGDTTAANTGAGYTTSASYYINIVAPAGQRHAGVYDSAKYYLSNGTNYTSALKNQAQYTRVSYLQINLTADGAYGYWSTVENDWVNSCIVLNSSGSMVNSNAYAFSVASGTYTNCLVYKVYTGFKIQSWAYSKFYNCTTSGCNTGFGGEPTGNRQIAKNCVAYNCTTPFKTVANWDTTNSTNNATSSADSGDVPGGDAQVSVVSDDFEDAAADDYHVASGSTKLKDLGVDLSSIFTTDIDGQTRTGTWDIGADQYVSAGGVQELAGTSAALAGTGGALDLFFGLAGAAGALSGITGQCFILRGVSGQVDAVSTTTGVLAAMLGLSGSPAAASDVSGVLGFVLALSGQSEALSEISGNLSIQGLIELSGSLAALSSASGGMGALYALGGQADGLATAVGSIDVTKAAVLLSGDIAALSAVFALLNLTGALSGSISAASTPEGGIRLNLRLSGPAAAVASLIGSLSVLGQSTLEVVIEPSIDSITARRMIESITTVRALRSITARRTIELN